jgi:hypothetical protein
MRAHASSHSGDEELDPRADAADDTKTTSPFLQTRRTSVKH